MSIWKYIAKLLTPPACALPCGCHNTHAEGMPLPYLEGMKVPEANATTLAAIADGKSQSEWRKRFPGTMTSDTYPGLPDEPELFPEIEEEDEDEEDPVAPMLLGGVETLTEGPEWEEVHPRYRSMSQAAHEALCIRRNEVKRHPIGFLSRGSK